MIQTEPRPGSVADAAIAGRPYVPSLGYLRAFVTVLVVLHHSALAYIQHAPPVSHDFTGGMMLWRALPIIDPQHWALALPIVSFNDTFFMSLMFLISGLFFDQSLKRKGIFVFLRDRALRLGVPFLFSALLITPVAYYFAWLQSGGTPGLSAYATAWRGVGYWPTGPAWFLLMLLAFDVLAALLFVGRPKGYARLDMLAACANATPAGLLSVVFALSFIAFVPMALVFGAWGWTYWGLFQFQTARIFHYLVYFLIGVVMGAGGTGMATLARDGRLATRWALWLVAMILGFASGWAVTIGLGLAAGPARQLLLLVVPVSFVLNCALYCFGFLALFARFVTRRNVVMDSLAANAYGIYVVHYAIVVALQYAVLSASLSGGTKAGVVVLGALTVSWIIVMALRRIPLASTLVGG